MFFIVEPTIQYSPHCLPEISINSGFEGFKPYYLRFREFVNDHVLHVQSPIKKPPPTCNHLKNADFDKESGDIFDVELNDNEDFMNQSPISEETNKLED